MREDEQKIKDEYGQKLEELKSEYIIKMKEIADKFDEKHMDLQSRRIDIEHQYEKALADYAEKHEPVRAHRHIETEDWEIDPSHYFDHEEQDSIVDPPRHFRGDIFETFQRYSDFPFGDEYHHTHAHATHAHDTHDHQRHTHDVVDHEIQPRRLQRRQEYDVSSSQSSQSDRSSESSFSDGYYSQTSYSSNRSGRNMYSNEDPYHIQNAEPVDYEPKHTDYTSPKDFEIDWKSPYKVTMPYSTILNLARRHLNEAFVDPLADIKKRERDLLREREVKEAELKRDYEKRL